MSATTIYAIKEKEEPIIIGEFKNAFRSAMYVWNDIATRYFDLDAFPMFDNDMRSRIWNASDEKLLSKSETIILALTMDRAVVKKVNISDLLIALNEYGGNHENSSFKEQYESIKEGIDDIPVGYVLAWNQTSVGEEWFLVIDKENDEYVVDISCSFDVIDQVRESA